MKITKRQLKRIISEIIDDDRDFSAPPGQEDYYAPGGEGEKITDAQIAEKWGPWLKERGLQFDDLDGLARFIGAPNRTWLPTDPPADGMVGPADIELWVRYKKTGIKEGKMKITKRQLRKLIREAAGQKIVDLMDENVSDQAIRDAWPQGVELDGVNIFNAVYQDGSVMNQVHAALEADGYEDANEVYLGYDFDSTDLIMGFDAFPAYYDEYGDRDMGGSEMEGVFVSIRTMGGMQPGRVVLSSPGGVYARGGVNMELERAFPGILHIRLD